MDTKPSDSTGPFAGETDRASVESEPPPEAFRAAMKQLVELKEFTAYLLAVKWDAFKTSIRNAGLYAVLGVVGLLAAGALVVTAVVLACVGLAQGIAALFSPPQPWAGNLIVGVVLLGGMGLGFWFVTKRILGASRKRTVQKYEDRKRHQRANFGEDVRSRAQDHRQE